MALHHAEAILTHDLPGALGELEAVLLTASLPITEIIRGGGGETLVTQRLRNSLAAIGWEKHNFEVSQMVDNVPREARTHEIDHVKAFGNHKVAMEIEWNNKDPFFDRDLENFQRLHAVGAISVGVIVTRGDSMQSAFVPRLIAFARANGINSAKDLAPYYTPTARQAATYNTGPGTDFAEKWARSFVGDKYATSTTHWSKLQERMARGVGNPCPLLLIGMPGSLIQS